MPTTSPPRETILERLAELDAAEPPTRDDDGTIRIGFACSMVSVHAVLACLPGQHARVYEHFTELFDDTGEAVDYELEEGIYTCDAEHILFAYADHWQAGLHGEVVLAASADAFQRELEQRLTSAREEEAELSGLSRGLCD